MQYTNGGWEFTGLNAIVNGIMGGGTVRTVLNILGSGCTKS